MYKSGYFLAGLFTWCAWLLVALNTIAFFSISRDGLEEHLIIAGIYLLSLLMCLFLLTFSQFLQAHFDTALSLRELVGQSAQEGSGAGPTRQRRTDEANKPFEYKGFSVPVVEGKFKIGAYTFDKEWFAIEYLDNRIKAGDPVPLERVSDGR